jgi:hypothetical protein
MVIAPLQGSKSGVLGPSSGPPRADAQRDGGFILMTMIATSVGIAGPAAESPVELF